jgi:hypothetical protein
VAIYRKYHKTKWVGPENGSVVKAEAAGSCGKHLNRCFVISAYQVLWLWQSQLQKPAVCFNLLAFFSGKLKKAQTNRPLVLYAS